MGKYVREPSYVSAQISHQLREQIELEADHQQTTLSSVVKKILEQHFGLDSK